MKHWSMLAFIVAGLSCAIYFQSLERRAMQKANDVTALLEYHPIPDEEPSPQPEAVQPRLTFGGYPCAGDCAQDKAGYQWAAQGAIIDPDACTGDTAEFIEGCRVYAQRRSKENMRHQ